MRRSNKSRTLASADRLNTHAYVTEISVSNPSCLQSSVRPSVSGGRGVKQRVGEGMWKTARPRLVLSRGSDPVQSSSLLSRWPKPRRLPSTRTRRRGKAKKKVKKRKKRTIHYLESWLAKTAKPRLPCQTTHVDIGTRGNDGRSCQKRISQGLVRCVTRCK